MIICKYFKSNTRLFKRIIFLFFFYLLPVSSWGFFIESNILYYDNYLKSSATTQTTDMAIDFTLGLDLIKSGRFTAGWDYQSLSGTTKSDSTTTKTTATGMGPKIKYFLNKEKNWGLGISYILNSTVKYETTGSTAQEWRGSLMKVEFGYAQELSENFFTGLNLNYYSSTLTESIVSTTYSAISYTQRWIYPTFFIAYRP